MIIKNPHKVKTSTRITLQFTIWIAVVVGVLLIALNALFLASWVHNESQEFGKVLLMNDIQPRNSFSNGFQRQDRIIAINSAIPIDISSYNVFRGIETIKNIDSRWWIVGKNSNNYVFMDVTQNVNRQLGLLTWSIIMRGVMIALSYFVGRYFVKTSLRDLRTLAKQLHNRDSTQNNNTSLLMDHLPKNDEINEIAYALEGLEKRVKGSYDNLRNFVSHVSHELKTPLMVMNSDLDVALRSKEYPEGIQQAKLSIHNMQNIIDILLMITRLEETQLNENTIFKKQTLKIYPFIEKITKEFQQKYEHKNATYTIHTEKNSLQEIDANEQLAHILLANIIDNARKYGNEKIDITIGEKTISIENIGNISEESLPHIRDPFWQEDKNRKDGIGIGLSLAKQITQLHGRKITYTSTDNTVECTIHF